MTYICRLVLLETTACPLGMSETLHQWGQTPCCRYTAQWNQKWCRQKQSLALLQDSRGHHNRWLKSDNACICMSIRLKAPTAALDLTCTLWRWIVPGRSSVPVDAHSDIRPVNTVASITSVLNVFAQVVGRARAALHASMRGNLGWAAWRMTWRS